MQFEIILAIIFTVWLLSLSVALFLLFTKLKRAFKGVDTDNLLTVIEKVLTTEVQNSRQITKIRKDIERIEKDGVFHVQKLGIVRFNPFDDLGGDHSFVVAMLDGKEDGFIITGLHTRDRTRVYIKPVLNGKSQFELSSEEKKALLKAKKES